MPVSSNFLFSSRFSRAVASDARPAASFPLSSAIRSRYGVARLLRVQGAYLSVSWACLMRDIESKQPSNITM